MEKAFVGKGHGYETGSMGRCTAFDGYTIVATPLGGRDKNGRELRVFKRPDGRGGERGTDYGSHVIALARHGNDRTGLYILMHHGGGREVLKLPHFYDDGSLEQMIVGLDSRRMYALLYTFYQLAYNARSEASQNTAQEWAQAYDEKRLRKRRATKYRAGRIEITPRRA